MNDPVSKIIFPFYFLYRIYRWNKDDHSPLIASLKITKQCTLKCLHCPWIYGEKNELPPEQWKHIIYKLKKQGVRGIVIEGGEPLLYSHLKELIYFTRNLGITTTVASNATISLAGYYPDKFYVSVDGLKKQHDALRGEGAFDTMVSNLKTTSVDIIALVSISKINVNHIDEILDFFKERVSGFWFSFIYKYNASENIALSRDERHETAERLLSLKNSYNIVNMPSYLKHAGEDRQCRDWMLTTVSSDGSVKDGCMIEAIEKCDCSRCDLACHRELSDFADMHFFSDNIKDYFKRIRRKKR
ncbi:MAG: radical SAM protein [candidate division WOR-3 bacterium]|nr:radical SAM protein [candidate division WOR-3 bacterium]